MKTEEKPCRAKIEIEIMRNTKGDLFINFGGLICGIKDTMDNNVLISNLDVEIDFALKQAALR